MENIKLFIKNNLMIIMIIIIAVLVISVMVMIVANRTSKFKTTLITPMDQIDPTPPQVFSPLTGEIDGIKLEPPVVNEEIGLAMVYPQGSGASMSKLDSNSFTPSSPGPLLTDYTIPESYGESSLTDPTGTNGAGQGSRILKIKSAGNQMGYKPVDESHGSSFAGAYGSSEVQNGNVTLINGAQSVDYSSSFNPNDNLKIQTSPGQESTISNCETTYPNVVKYNDFCITDGDIPYGQIVENKVNPRLVSRWESFTGDYSREAALEPIDGLLYPNLNVLVK